MARYEYQKLPTTSSIRLLRIEKSSKPTGLQIPPPEEPIRLALSLSVFELDEAPDYDAVSYTWGDPTSPYSKFSRTHYNSAPSVEVEVNAQSLLISQSVTTVLTRVYHADLEKNGCGAKSEYVWADGICINQDDLDERASQVAQMGSIYAEAANVLIWLGEVDEFTDDAMTALEMIATIDPARYSEVSMIDWGARTTVLKDKGLVDWTSTWAHWLGLEVLLNRPWFTRVWVIQEAVVNDNNIILCGDKVLPWTLLAKSLDFLYSSTWGMANYDDYYRKNCGCPSFPSNYVTVIWKEQPRWGGIAGFSRQAILLQMLRRRWRNQQRRGVELEWILRSEVRSRYASDPRDKIYALGGLVDKTSGPPLRRSAVLTPDYRLPTEILFTRTTRMILEANGDLEWLHQTQNIGRSTIPLLPSWVADYRISGLPTVGFSRLSKSGESFMAHGETAWQVSPASMDQTQLEVQGIAIDRVTRVPNFPKGRSKIENLSAMIQLAAHIRPIQRLCAPR